MDHDANEGRERATIASLLVQISTYLHRDTIPVLTLVPCPKEERTHESRG